MEGSIAFTVPDKKAVKKAGNILRSEESSKAEIDEATQTLSQWRGLHSYPLIVFQGLLRGKIKRGKYSSPIIAQRLKRMPSILMKLKRFSTMNLSKMQDIGGIRIILKDIEEVYKLHKSLTTKIQFDHQPELPPKDYIKEPKSDGYRSLHQVFKFISNGYPELNGLRIELQIRTRLQHSWATAVETLGMIEKSSFKTGEGDESFKEFFKLSSALFSIEEKYPVLSEYESKSSTEIKQRLLILEKELQICHKLTSLAHSIKSIEQNSLSSSGYHILELNSEKQTVSLISFSEKQLHHAESLYTALEQKTKETPTVSIVLISAGKIKNIKKAYPNYFLDTTLFVQNLRTLCDIKK